MSWCTHWNCGTPPWQWIIIVHMNPGHPPEMRKLCKKLLNIEIYEVLVMFIVATTAGYSSFSRNKLAAIIKMG